MVVENLKFKARKAQAEIVKRREEHQATWQGDRGTPRVIDRCRSTGVAQGDLVKRREDHTSRQGDSHTPRVVERRSTVSNCQGLAASGESLVADRFGNAAPVALRPELARQATCHQKRHAHIKHKLDVVASMQDLRGGIGLRSAYMGMDWFECRRTVSLLFFFQHLYYWCYAFYIVGLVVVGGIVMWALSPEDMTLAAGIYSAAACVSQSGLAVLDWSKQSKSTYIVSFVLILLGSASLLHMVPVVLRIYSFKMQAGLSMTRRKKQSSMSGNGGAEKKESFLDVQSLITRRNRAFSDPALGRDTREEEEESSAGSAFSEGEVDEDVVGNADSLFGNNTSRLFDEEHYIEYKALQQVLVIMVSYWLVTHLIGFAIFYSYFKFGSGHIVDKFYSEGLQPETFALYVTVSAFQNNGLVTTPSSVMDFAHSPILLNTIGALILCGNTGLPIMVRLIARILHRLSQQHSDREKALRFLLLHPRRCFTHLFPAVHTAWLLIVIIVLNGFMTFILVWQDYDSRALSGLTFMGKVWNGLFQAISSRTAGLNSVNLADLSQATTFCLAFMMFLATTPTVVVMRFSASLDLDITGRKEGVEEEVITGDNSLKNQARRYLWQDLTYLMICLLFILVLEKEQFNRSARYVSPDSDGIYFDFSFFKVLFELISAYGTCGLSLGYQDQSASFSGVWTVPSQMLLVFVMILGRLRGLPDSIDPSVRASMVQRKARSESLDGAERDDLAFLHV
eukprot:TRINITY_DN27634_c0_g1_i1.p1 TRINITY_DN27634_c0_g1~~TRINITY_DN27634_c0_g1_i1.p1  ORF type:complete len:812 (-),score=134.37 TRINITY_DN27634_c0_g1_i1:73-2283(-)